MFLKSHKCLLKLMVHSVSPRKRDVPVLMTPWSEKVVCGVNKQSQINRSSLICAADQPHGATTRSREGTEGLAVIWGLAFSL